MYKRHSRSVYVPILCSAVLCSLLVVSSAAQSLDPKKPAPLQPGGNPGTVDNTVGANYFYFWAGPGDNTVRASYKSMSFLGNAMRSTLTIELSDEKRTWTSRKTITSLNQAGEVSFSGTLKEKTKIIVAVIPPGGSLIRTGGDYELEATGAVHFDPLPSATDMLVGVYTPKTIHENEDTAVRFSPDGTLEFASGTRGTWKMFDATDRIVTVSFLNTRLSLKLLPGRGLVETNDPSSVVFQRNR